MKLTSEKLLTAIEEYDHLPEKQRILSSNQVQWFSEPENVFLLISSVLTLPDEMMDKIGDSVDTWVDVAVSELALTANKLPPEIKRQFEEAIGFILNDAQEKSWLNTECVLLCLSILKRHQFNIRIDTAKLLDKPKHANDSNIKHFPKHQPTLGQLIDEFGIKSGIEFIEFFEHSFSIAPPETIPYLLSEVTHYSWGIDALLLLTQYFEEPIALASAQVIDSCPSSVWKNLSYLQLFNLCVRFNRHPAIKPCFKRWKKHAMAHNKVRATAEIHELYASHVDGNDCASMMLKITLEEQLYQINMMLDFKSGIRESMLNLNPELSIPELIGHLDTEIDFYSVSPAWLGQVLPWILSVQQEKNTPLDLYSLYWLSHLPFEWTQPEAFELEHWSQKLGYQEDLKRRERNRLELAMGSQLILSWLAPEECLLKAKKPRDLLKLYYYANRELFAERLTYSAAVERYKQSPNSQCFTNDYLDLAHTLSDPSLNRKKFALFDTLAEASFELFNAELDSTSVDMPEQGLVIKVSLLEASPPVWRRIRLSNQITLSGLHYVIQGAMGWESAHLFRFEINGMDIPEEHYDQLPIGIFLRETEDELNYQYDFGDNWFHQITVEKVLEKDINQPEIIAGNGMCPVEDSGGVWSWNNLLKLRKNKSLTEEEAEMLEWAGLSPDKQLEPFDKQQANDRLKMLFGD
ncbi:plasmid pRiA4b ORF-3 family protein [Xenorhabdus sp. 12]|uniref:Plasmid pRiA4b ORF-3 family protein n=1 Tax=Xenorhabdus santafensis TaxID=2582833 RepID=A0ABU4S6P8_9GAMM|nr:plasmid pRiA4b ORF-3 family protein [Xenorhabdus sp. 12]MDX7986358.1 plasmid pRiA4b ORF-3 family protein [Xenorhabdus sp. 12]